MTKPPRILLWDLETSHNLLLAFDLRNDNDIPYGNIITERHIFCVAYKWLGEKKIHTISIRDDKKRFKKNVHDDYHVVNEFRKVLEQADAQVFHYGNRFDAVMFNTRLAFHNLPPVPKMVNIDTKALASTYFKFNSNRLDYLARHLGYKGKMENPSNLWIKCFEGDVPSLKHMEKYNRQDIDILEYIYRRLIPFVHTQKLNLNMFLQGAHCPNAACGSTNIQWRGYSRTRVNNYRRFQCQECGTWSDERKALHDIKPQVK